MGRSIWLYSVLLALGASFLLGLSQPSSPIVIVPGILGNQMEGKLNKTTVPHNICVKETSDYVTLWLAVTKLLPFGMVDCLADNMRLVYNSTTKVYQNAPGVDIRIPGFGNTSSVEYLDPETTWFSVTQYFYKMVQHFVDKGYTRGKDIVAAPYDWRVSPNQFISQGYYANLKKLIETTYAKNNNQQVVLIAHSMGAPTSLFFLTKMVSQEWKDTYIRDYITIAGVWHGAAKCVKTFASGENEGIWIVPQFKERASQRTYPASAWLLPYPSDTWTKEDVLITTPKKNYSAWDYKELFEDMGYPRGYDMFTEIDGLTSGLLPPNVRLHCLYGTHVSTAQQFIYGIGEFPDTKPKEITGDGDGTVNTKSLMACKRWQTLQSHNVTLRAFPGVEHLHAIKDPDIIKYVDNVIYNQPQ